MVVIFTFCFQSICFISITQLFILLKEEKLEMHRQTLEIRGLKSGFTIRGKI